jgi:hypothetical protein
VGSGVGGRGTTSERLLHRGRPERGRSHVDECHVAALNSHADDRPVDGALGELLEGPRGVARLGDADFGQQLAGRQGGPEQAAEELAGPDLAPSRRAERDQRRFEREDDRGQVTGRIAVRQRAADRAAVADLRVARR